MSVLVVIENPEDCSLVFSGVEPVAARTYLTDETFTGLRGVKIINICRSYRYQSMGYYVSLLAEARGHKPIPSITAIQDMKSVGIIRVASGELEDVLAKALADREPGKVSFSAYFGKTPEKGLEQLASRLFKLFPAPFLRADVSFQNGWQLQNVSPLSVKDIPPGERDFAESVSTEYFAGKKLIIPKRPVSRYDLAILHDPEEARPPSSARAIKRFVKAAETLGVGVELITKDDSNRLSEFDALFIRETTNVDHHTYRMARKAVAEGLVVIDDPESILRCSNKVYLAEVLARHKIPAPRTVIAHCKNLDHILEELSLPCVLKQPDSAFSQGVVLVRESDVLMAEARRFLSKSDLVIAQEYLPSDFDWRIGILDRRPLFACKYFMASGHWQILRKGKSGKDIYGRVETLPVGKVPRKVISAALKAADAIGDGLYGVDLKQVGDKVYVIEVNDNPNIDAGYEDEVLQDELYLRVVEVFLKRIELRKTGSLNI
ncbi:RimK domain protein ATP-grasp [Solidesulfovibrio fructosivorans JJ]]|uniref:RimK domain protein ATP-grasp n=1 Tax=Solidesulfovibrio fructosivorans JJ] TaxID=596151 RepID=E1JYY5_SOLFR|nr:RimK family protein [Solidesulfovibrio fructosivorans]EFL50401.1 RimK domain protein ATP-grasp [Solidesulfovibrio fructosivorans JJ]]